MAYFTSYWFVFFCVNDELINIVTPLISQMFNIIDLPGSNPPNVEQKNYRKYVVILITCITGIFGHLAFASLFWVFQVDILSYLNMLSVAIWLWAAFMNYRGYHSLAIYVICGVILVMITTTVALLGLGFGFQMYLWPVACLAVINPGLRKLYGFIFGLSFIIYVALIHYLFADVPDHSQLSEYAETIYILNIVVAGLPLIIGITSIRGIYESQEKMLTDLATIDDLTGLFNRRYANRYLKKHCHATNPHSNNFCVVIGDVDHFKKINDEFGHHGGDTVLSVISTRLKHAFRQTDVVSRWGGEEFLIVLCETDAEKAYMIVDRIRKEISKSITVDKTTELEVTMSFGIASTAECEDVMQMIKLADDNLYHAKNNGRNCVVVKPEVNKINGFTGLART